ncbi:MAG TPA: cohesin domain-containing protein [Bacteroidota bacterium]
MKRIIAFIAAVVVLSGCGKKNNPVSPPTVIDFPPDTKFSVTLYSPAQSVSVGGTFEVRVVLYNVSNVFGAALSVSYPGAVVDVLGVTGGGTFLPAASVIDVSRIEPDSNRVSYAVSYENATTGSSSTGSGVLCRIQCRAKASGTAAFAINQSTLEIKTANGTLIPGFSNLLVENLSIGIH